MKKAILTLLLISMVFTASSCRQEKEDAIVKERPVKTVTLKSESKEDVLKYLGSVQPKSVLKKSFETGGTIKNVAVKTGQKISIGDLLASLDSSKIDIASNSSGAQASAAYQDYQKAADNVTYLRKQYADTKALFEGGAASNQQVTDVKLQLDVAEKSLSQAKSIYTSAALQSEYNQTLKGDSNIISDVDGYVIDILQKEGEIVGAGYPVMVLRTNELVVKIGVSSEDKLKIKEGDSAFLSVGDKKLNAIVGAIKSVPDTKTNTYEVEISVVDSKNLNIGDMVDAGIIVGKSQGIWINLSNVLSDGFDYVYVVKDGRAYKKNVKVLSIIDEKARLSGIEKGDELIISGYSSISDGYRVKVIERDGVAISEDK